MTIEVQQTWWHIEEIYFPSFGRRIRQVMDFFTDEEDIIIDSLNDCEFVGLKIIARNNGNKEIPFLERVDSKKISLVLNLRPLNQFPQPSKGFGSKDKLFQIRIEIEYILTRVNIVKYNYKPVRDRIFPKRFSSQGIQGKIQPEFYLTLPLGWKVAGQNEGDAVNLSFVEEDTSSGANSIKMAKSHEKEIDLTINEPFVKKTDGKRTYNYVIDDEKFLETKNKEGRYILSYESALSLEIVGLSLFRYVFLIISASIIVLGIFRMNNSIQTFFDSNFGMAYLIVLLGFAYYYGNLIYKGYEIPRKDDFIYIFIVSLVAILIVFLMPYLLSILINPK